MKRRAFLVAAGALAAPAWGQRRDPPRIGAIEFSDNYAPAIDGLRAGLKELGLVEGRDLLLDVRDARGDAAAIEAAARQFEKEGAALIYCLPLSASLPVKRATRTVPVVFCVGSDPTSTGLVESYAQPGGRMTGVHYLTVDLTAKRLELLKELLPKLASAVTFYNPGNPAAQLSARHAREAGKRLGVQFLERHVRTAAEIRAAVDALKRGEADAFFFVSDALLIAHAGLIIDKARAIRMPTMVYEQTLVERGALATYGVDIREVGRYSAKYVQRILAGARPGELPVENVTRLVAVLNQRTAKAIGIKVPPATIVRFDRVIE